MDGRPELIKSGSTVGFVSTIWARLEYKQGFTLCNPIIYIVFVKCAEACEVRGCSEEADRCAAPFVRPVRRRLHQGTVGNAYVRRIGWSQCTASTSNS